MSDAIINKLSEEWEIAKSDECYRRLGKILRSLVNYLKSVDSGIKMHERDLLDKIEFLQNELPKMDYGSAMQVIGDVRHARKSVKATSGTWGSAFRVELSATERRKIRKRNRSSQSRLENGLNGASRNIIASDRDVVLLGDTGSDD